MRLTLARLALATTSLVALAFCLPLAVLAQQIAYDRAVNDAKHDATALVATLAATGDRAAIDRAVASTGAGGAGRITVHFPGEEPLGTPHATPAEVTAATTRRESRTVEVHGGLAYLQAVALDPERTVVVEVYVPDADLTRGVHQDWLVLVGVAAALVAGSVFVADRLGARLVRDVRELARAARGLGDGDLTARANPSGPPELRAVGRTFNVVADRVTALVESERRLAADLSHRLRTPLTALRLDAEVLPMDPGGDRIRQAVDILDAEIDAIIRGVTVTDGPVDLVDVLADRLAFWSVLAEDHGRAWSVLGGESPVLVAAPRAELVAAVDALLGNVFAHTPQGTPFRVLVGPAGLVVEDAGPGIERPEVALRRGSSGAGSTGLGLDIVRRVAATMGGAVTVDRGEWGGARVTMTVADVPAFASGPRAWRRSEVTSRRKDRRVT
ncbi:two-component sensor histidine kinase [Longispora fulva]|uniref:histidine kinase n=1 Tax=Longispora fulva TaxID=619741 RepID=A0A8J7KIU6_9ACTN|nr:HAMP domain-containing sensor histidine kinase [Longispora fulva]MBG6134751.1 signal transduction histidine kinase [Longispora fulva]GIG61962.1 two-component sensor histidine kinase [Longispora fulva]